MTSRTAVVAVDGRATITVDPEDVSLFAGQTLTLDVEAEGVGLTYQWQLDGEDLADATEATYTKVAEIEDSGSYVALVRNGAGEVASAPANVVVHGPPVIVTPPSAATVFGSTELTLSVVASGESLTYQWRKDEIAIEGATDATYRVTATSDLAGQYDVVVSNPAGTVTATAVAVVVHGPPVIVTPPSGLTSPRDTNVSLTVIATGEALTYRWFRDETEVQNASEATLTLTLNEATAGEYVVAVSNPAGTVETEPVTVALEDEPQPDPGPEAEVEPTPEEPSDTDTTAEAEAETVTKGRTEDGCAGGSAGMFGGLLGLILILRARGAKP